ncbi:hypothetical protein ABH920_005573 [Catenulispora sp. EB89]|uniref:contact-dependent growth inhibition system immunity protein n=1 Tax=Catenulispora sp. EB89 TaxID=3156257 RepID=UPI003515E4E9
MTPITVRTLEDLDGAWGDPPAAATRLIATAHKLRRLPLSALQAEDLRLLIGQNIGLSNLVPLALELLRNDPLAAGDFYEGALLKAVLSVDRTFWAAHDELADQVRAVVAAIEDPPSLLAAAIAAFDVLRPGPDPRR